MADPPIHPDLIITDLQMPAVDGLEMCRQLRLHARRAVGGAGALQTVRVLDQHRDVAVVERTEAGIVQRGGLAQEEVAQFGEDLAVAAELGEQTRFVDDRDVGAGQYEFLDHEVVLRFTLALLNGDFGRCRPVLECGVPSRRGGLQFRATAADTCPVNPERRRGAAGAESGSTRETDA